jgi:hypothetical protein
MHSSHLPSTVRAALGKALGLAGTSLLVIVGLAGTAMARPLPDGGAGGYCTIPPPVVDDGSSSLLMTVPFVATVILLSGLVAVIVAVRQRAQHQSASTT